jgi:hypothetical protein
MADDAPGAPAPQPPAPGPRHPAPGTRPSSGEFSSKVLAVVFLLALMVLLLSQVPWASETAPASLEDTTGDLGEFLFESRGESFLLLSIVMGVAIIGGLFLAREDFGDDVEVPGPRPDEQKGKAAAEPPEEDWDGGAAP